MCGSLTPLHCHSVAVCNTHSSVGPGHAAVTPVTITGHPSMAVACRWCDSLTVPPRPLCIPTLHSHAPSSPVTCHLPWHDVRYSNTFTPLNAELNPFCHLLALLGAHHIFHFSGLRIKVPVKLTL